jgi:hypothetical protein
MNKHPFNLRNYSLKAILLPEHSALLVMDMQNDFLPHIQGLIEAPHQAHIPVIFTKGYQDVRFRSGPDLRRVVKWHEYNWMHG